MGHLWIQNSFSVHKFHTSDEKELTLPDELPGIKKLGPYWTRIIALTTFLPSRTQVSYTALRPHSLQINPRCTLIFLSSRMILL